MKKTTKQWLNYETDEMILFAHETGGPDAVKHVAERIQKALASNDFEAVEERYYAATHKK